MYPFAARPLQTATPVRPRIVAVKACQGKNESQTGAEVAEILDEYWMVGGAEGSMTYRQRDDLSDLIAHGTRCLPGCARPPDSSTPRHSCCESSTGTSSLNPWNANSVEGKHTCDST
jgi:hypothetical protein